MAKILVIDTNQDGVPDTKVFVEPEITAKTATLQDKNTGKLEGRINIKEITPTIRKEFNVIKDNTTTSEEEKDQTTNIILIAGFIIIIIALIVTRQ